MSDLEALSTVLSARVARGDVPAVVAAVVDPDDVLYLEAFGERDVARSVDATADTIFRIASMTKPITSLAAMMLVDEGRIGLDDPIAKHLPGYHRPDVLGAGPSSLPITVRHLLTHTSGIAYPFFAPALAGISPSTPAIELPLAHEPGAQWTYGPGTAVLGQLVASVANETLDAFCQKRIFDPLAMKDTGYAVPRHKTDRVITQHQRGADGTLTEKPNPPVIQSRGRGDDGLLSTARDYASFLQLFLNGGRRGATRLIGEESIRMMGVNQIGPLVVRRLETADPAIARPFPPGAGTDHFGFGFQIANEPAPAGMRGAGSMSWAGIFNTFFWIDPVKRIAAVVMMQLLPANDEKVVALLREFETMLYASIGAQQAQRVRDHDH
jgi:methyl acetate hydrolase